MNKREKRRKVDGERLAEPALQDLFSVCNRGLCRHFTWNASSPGSAQTLSWWGRLVSCVTSMGWWWLPGLVLVRTQRLCLEVAVQGAVTDEWYLNWAVQWEGIELFTPVLLMQPLIGVKGSEFKQSVLQSLCVLDYSYSVFKIKKCVFRIPTSLFGCLL